jgi:hypothetical protein
MDFHNKTIITISLNNQAAQLIETGDFDEAISKLAKAVLSSKDLMADAEDSRLPIQIMSLDRNMTQSPPSSSVPENDIEHSVFLLYRRSIFIDEENAGVDYEGSLVISISVIFNLALAYQLSAMDNDNTHYMKKAAKLYKLAHRSVVEEELDSATFFAIACANNLALICVKDQDHIAA